MAADVPSVSIHLSVLTREKLPCAHWTTPPGKVRNLGKTQHLEFECSCLPLVPDDYSLSVAVFNEAALQQLLWHYNVGQFTVEGENDFIGTPVELPGCWRIGQSSLI